MKEYTITVNNRARIIRADGWQNPHTIARAIAWAYMPSTRITIIDADGNAYAFTKTIDPDGSADIVPMD